MTSTEWLRVMQGGARASGKTYQAASAAQAMGRDAILVCVNEVEAKRVKQDYPGNYTAVGLDKDLTGTHKPLVFDPDAFCEILWRQDREHQKEIAAYRAEIETLIRKHN